MVHGLEKFKEYFENHKNQYVLLVEQHVIFSWMN